MAVEFNFEVKDVLTGIDSYVMLDTADFFRYDVQTSNLISSNDFLKSLWNQMNNLVPAINAYSCPWAYIPIRLSKDGYQLTYFGSVRTSITYYHVAVIYKKKGTIETLLLQPFGSVNRLCDIKEITDDIINQAKLNIHKKICFLFQAEIYSRGNSDEIKYKYHCYKSDSFNIISDDNSSIISYYSTGIDTDDAFSLALNKLSLIIDFLSVETNTEIGFTNPVLLYDTNLNMYSDFPNSIYQNQIDWGHMENDIGFIDSIPLYEDAVAFSEESIKIIEAITNESFDLEGDLSIFLKSCYHFHNSLRSELRFQGETIEVGASSIMIKSQKITHGQSIIDNAVTGYLSAIETLTLIGIVPMKCSECGQSKFEISKRIEDFIDKNLWPGYGRVFKKIYHLRSLYLHTGLSSTKIMWGNTKPLLDPNTGTCAIDSYHFSLNLDGSNFGVCIPNLREWTSFSIRNFYKKNIIEKL